MRLSMYVHKRQHGVTVVVRRKLQVQADTTTGQTQWTITQWKVRRVVVLPEKRQREVRQNAGAMAANRAIIQGTSFDTGGRHFLFDRSEVPPTWCCKKDDWIVFNDRHYDIESVTDYEYGTGLAGDRQGTARAGGGLRHADDAGLDFRSAYAPGQLPHQSIGRRGRRPIRAAARLALVRSRWQRRPSPWPTTPSTSASLPSWPATTSRRTSQPPPRAAVPPRPSP